MNIRQLTTIALLASIGLGGCATMSGDECMTSDWHAIGFEDGSRGYNSDRLRNHRKACAKHGVTPDFQAYQTGRDQGLDQFCQPSRAFNLGVNGGSYNGVCSAHGEVDFVDAYNSGYHLHNLRSQVISASNQIHYKEQELDRNKDLMRTKEADLIANETTVQDRILILADLKELAESNGHLEAEIIGLIEDRAVHEQEVASYEAMLASADY